MYEKILVPLDQSMESQDVLPLVQELLTPEGETILLHIIPPARTTLLGESVMAGESRGGGRTPHGYGAPQAHRQPHR